MNYIINNFLSKTILCFALLCGLQNGYSQPMSSIILKDVPPSFNLSSIIFSPDSNKLIITAGMIGEEGEDAVVWDTNTGEKLFKLDHTDMITGTYMDKPIGRGYVFNAAFSPDGKKIVTGASPLIAVLWDAETGEAIHAFQAYEEDIVFVREAGFTAVGFTPDSKKIIATTLLGETYIWDILSGQIVKHIQFEYGASEKIGFIADSNLIYLTGEGNISVHTLENGDKVYNDSGGAVTISKDKRYFYMFKNSCIQTHNLLNGLKEHYKQIPEILLSSSDKPFVKDISQNGKFFAIGKLKSIVDSTNLYSSDNGKDNTPLRIFEAPKGAIGEEPKQINFSPDSKKIAIRYPGDIVIIHDISDLTSNIPEAPMHK